MYSVKKNHNKNYLQQKVGHCFSIIIHQKYSVQLAGSDLGSIASTFYEQFLLAQIPDAQKRQFST